MKKCYFSKLHKPTKWLYIIVLASMILVMFLGIYCLFLDVWVGIGTIGVGLLASWYVCIAGLYMLRGYSLGEDGITIRYPHGKEVFHPWQSISKICLCEIHPGKGEGIADQVIWCTLGNMRREPPNMARRWRDADYLCYHYKSVLTIEFSEERLAEFQKYSNRAIPDYRDEVYR